MLQQIDHVGIAVAGLAAAIEWHMRRGLTSVGHVETVESQGVRVVMIQCGESCIELLEPTSPDSPVGKFLEKRGPGLHHIAYRVADIETEMARLRSEGVQLLGDSPRVGHGGHLVCFIHPRDCGGVLTELIQRR